MELTSSKEPGLQIVTVQVQRIDAAVALAFKDQMRAITDGETDIVLLDLNHVTFIDSSGLGAIVAAMKNLSPDRKLILAGMTSTVDKVFKLTRMDSVFGIFPTIEAALNTLHPQT
ncbi:MAG: STAS domain-containing protein [Sulfitobacter sp.]